MDCGTQKRRFLRHHSLYVLTALYISLTGITTPGYGGTITAKGQIQWCLAAGRCCRWGAGRWALWTSYRADVRYVLYTVLSRVKNSSRSENCIGLQYLVVRDLCKFARRTRRRVQVCLFRPLILKFICAGSTTLIRCKRLIFSKHFILNDWRYKYKYL